MENADTDARRLVSMNRKFARQIWGGRVGQIQWCSLREVTERFRFSVCAGDLCLFQGTWYVTHLGLLRVASKHRCAGIQVEAVLDFCDLNSGRWVFKATVYRSKSCRGFVGYGDADPSNVSPVVHGAEMRVAETRAVNRALRKAYGIGICSVEELGFSAESQQSSPESKKLPPQPANGNCGGPKVRDRLCQLIRLHQLDANLVKSYAIDFCGTKTLREASREQVENFVTHLADWAEKDRNALLCQLNSYLASKDGAA
jgi:hypothetical protein